MSVHTYYVTMETVNGDFQYRTDWTGYWEFLNGSIWENVDDTEILQKTLTEYWETKKEG